MTNIVCDEGPCQNSSLTYEGLSIKEYHHKNIYNMLYHILVPVSQSRVTMAFSGHEICWYDDTLYRHKEGGIFGIACEDRRTMLITDASEDEHEIVTAIHELGHMFGVIDHYGGEYPTTEEIKNQESDPSYSSNCIYGENKEDSNIISKRIVCQGCRNKIMDNRMRFCS